MPAPAAGPVGTMAVKAIGALAGVAYPFLIYFGLQWLSPRMLAALVGLLLVLRVMLRPGRFAWRQLSPVAGAAALVVGLVGLAAILDDGRLLRLLPVVVNVGLFVAFARTLLRGASMVESLARLQHSTLPPGAILYCRRVTVVWSTFFAVNAALILWLSVAASLATWTLYTGLLAYLLAGAIFSAERVYRASRFRQYGQSPVDTILRRVFPPRVGA